MHVYLDESGVHLKTGHSVFVLVQIELSDLPAITDAAVRFEQSIKPSTFHWKDMSWVLRDKAFRTIAELPFSYQVAIMNNPLSNNMALAGGIIAGLLAEDDSDIAAIYIDGRQTKSYESALKKALRDAGIKTRKLRTVNDRAYAGIQIADSIAGLYHHQIDKPSPEAAALQALINSHQK